MMTSRLSCDCWSVGIKIHSTDIGEEQTRCSVFHRHGAVQTYTTAHQPWWHTRIGRRIQKTYRETDIWQLSSPGGNCQDMEPRGETPGGMSIYRWECRTIPTLSRYEEEIDGLDARDVFWRWACGSSSWAEWLRDIELSFVNNTNFTNNETEHKEKSTCTFTCVHNQCAFRFSVWRHVCVQPENA